MRQKIFINQLNNSLILLLALLCFSCSPDNGNAPKIPANDLKISILEKNLKEAIKKLDKIEETINSDYNEYLRKQSNIENRIHSGNSELTVPPDEVTIYKDKLDSLRKYGADIEHKLKTLKNTVESQDEQIQWMERILSEASSKLKAANEYSSVLKRQLSSLQKKYSHIKQQEEERRALQKMREDTHSEVK